MFTEIRAATYNLYQLMWYYFLCFSIISPTCNKELKKKQSKQKLSKPKVKYFVQPTIIQRYSQITSLNNTWQKKHQISTLERLGSEDPWCFCSGGEKITEMISAAIGMFSAAHSKVDGNGAYDATCVWRSSSCVCGAHKVNLLLLTP